MPTAFSKKREATFLVASHFYFGVFYIVNTNYLEQSIP